MRDRPPAFSQGPARTALLVCLCWLGLLAWTGDLWRAYFWEGMGLVLVLSAVFRRGPTWFVAGFVATFCFKLFWLGEFNEVLVCGAGLGVLTLVGMTGRPRF